MLITPYSTMARKGRIGGNLNDSFRPKIMNIQNPMIKESIKTLDGVDYKRTSWRKCKRVHKFRERHLREIGVKIELQ